MHRWAALLVVALLALALWLGWRRPDGAAPAALEASSAQAPTPSRPAVEPAERVGLGEAVGGSKDLARAPIGAEESAGSGATVRCVWEPDRAPAVGVPVTAYPMNGEAFGEALGSRITGADGAATFADLAPGDHTFVAVRERVRVRVVAGAAVEAEIELPVAADVTGRVVTQHGAMVDRAAVHAEAAGIPQRVTSTGPDGGFALRLAIAAKIWATHEGHAPSELILVDADRSELVLVLGPAGASLSGVVLDPDGRAVAGARVVIAPAAAPEGHRLARPPVMLETDARGGFATAQIERGAFTVYAAAAGFAFGQAEVATDAAGLGTVTVRLRRAARIRGQLLGGANAAEPLTGVPVLVHRQRDLAGLLVGTSDRLTRFETVTASDGTFAIEGVPPGRMWLVAMVSPKPVHLNLALAEGEDYVWTPDLSRPAGRITGVLRGPDGQPLTGWRVDASRLDLIEMAMERATAETDGAGRFELVELRTEPHALAAFSPGGELIAKRADVRPDLPPLDWRLDGLPRDGGAILGRLVDAQGDLVEGARLEAVRDGVTRKAAFDAAEFRIEGVLPGTWRVRGQLEDYGTFDLGPVAVGARATVDLGSLRLPPRGRLAVRLGGEGGEPAGLEVELKQLDGGRNSTAEFVRDGERTWWSPLLPPGRYRLVVRGPTFAPVVREVEVPAGGAGEVEVLLRPATTVVFEFVPGELTGAEWNDDLRHELRDAAGDVILSGWRPVRGAPTATLTLGLAPGAYALEASSPNVVYRAANLRFVVPAGATGPHRVRVDLEVQRRR